MYLVGKIDYEAEVKINPLNLDFSKFTEPKCEHCHTNHNRKHLYVVQLDDGNLIQVGKGCLDKLFPKDYNYDVTNYNENDLLQYLLAGYNSKQKYYNTRDLLYVLIQFNKMYGLDNKKFNNYYQDKEFIKTISDIKNRDYTETDTVINWYKTAKLYNDFQISVQNLILSKYIETKYINIFKYAYKIYINASNYKPEYNSVAVNYTETIIDKIEIVDVHNYSYGYYNDVNTKVYRIIDDKDNVFQYETSSSKEFKISDKISYKIKGTYKSKKYGIVNKITYIKIK